MRRAFLLLARLSHYLSTHCLHGHHGECRQACKHCPKKCRCGCHHASRAEAKEQS